MVDPNHHICRIEGPVQGWQYRILWRGEDHNKFFSDSKYGGKRKALILCREARDEKLSELASGDRVVEGKDLGVRKEGTRYVALCPQPGGGLKKPAFDTERWTDDGAFFRAYRERRIAEKRLVK